MVVSHSASELERDGLTVAEKAPDDGYYDWTNKETGEVQRIPRGVGPGWNYSPKAAWGQKLSDNAMKGWNAQGANAWERLTPGNWETYGRPERVDADKAKATLGKKVAASEIESEIKKIIGGDKKVFTFSAGDFRYDVLVNAKTLAEHIDPARDKYIPFLRETLEEPFEVWLSFEKHKGTGKVVLRQRIIKAVQTGEKEGMLAVTNAVDGVMEAWTFMPVKDMDYLNRQRVGRLIWARQKK